jgi:hypothetical protein
MKIFQTALCDPKIGYTSVAATMDLTIRSTFILEDAE